MATDEGLAEQLTAGASKAFNAYGKLQSALGRQRRRPQQVNV